MNSSAPTIIEIILSNPGDALTACVCHTCEKTMRLVGVEPNPDLRCVGELFTYECKCGELQVLKVVKH